jgi:hypothetical protein
MARIILDVGASFGLFSNFIANQSIEVNGISTIQVFSVEPIPDVAKKNRR